MEAFTTLLLDNPQQLRGSEDNMTRRRKVKFEVQIQGFSAKFEGDEEQAQTAVSQVGQGLAGLAMLPGQMLQPDTDGGAKQLSAEVPAPVPTKDAPAERKQARARTPGGVSPQGIIETLIKDGFFAEAKGPEDVAEALSTKGYSYTPSALSTPLTRLTKKGLITREKGKEGRFLYKANS